LDRPEEDAPDVDSRLLSKEREVMVQQAVAVLPGRCRRLLLAAVADPPMSYNELSETLGMRIGSIGPTRARCLGELGRIIEELERRAGPEAAMSRGSCSEKRSV
jgi:DNA-directed RNA polymerase specialized sigma24 family protein